MTQTENNELKTNSENQTQKTQKDLDKKIAELWEIEEKFFMWDWKIWGENSDTKIDEEYKKWLERADNIQKKINLVEWLIEFFKKDKIDISTQKKSKYIDNEDKKNIDKIQNEINNLLKKYPEYKEFISIYIKAEMDYINFQEKFYEDDFKDNKNKENLNVIKFLLKENYKNFSENHISSIIEFIKQLEENKYISDKPAFLKYLYKSDVSIHLIRESLWAKIDKLFSYKIVSDWFNDDEKSASFNETFWYWTLCEFIKIPEENINKLNNFYIKWNNKELVEYIDSKLSIEQRDKFLAFNKIKNIYLNVKKEESPDLEKFSNDLIISLNNIKDTKLKDRIKKFLDIFTAKNTDKKSISEFFNEWWEFDDLISSTSNINDKIFTLDVIEFAVRNSDWVLVCTPFYSDLNQKLANRFLKLKNQEKELIEKEINNLKKKYKDNPKILSRIESDVENARKSEDIKDDLYILQKDYLGWLNNHSQVIRTKEEEKLDNKMEKSKISESKKTQIQNNYEKLWLKVQVSENWELLWKNWEKNFSQKIQNWKIEVWAQEKLIYTTSLGYKFELENSEVWNDKILEITKTFNYLNKIWLWYFGENLKSMFETLRSYLPNQTWYLSIDEKSWDFLNMRELNEIIIPIFQNIWFIDKTQNLDYLLPEEVTDLEMINRVSKIEEWKAFIDWKFNREIFWELLQKTNKV